MQNELHFAIRAVPSFLHILRGCGTGYSDMFRGRSGRSWRTWRLRSPVCRQQRFHRCFLLKYRKWCGRSPFSCPQSDARSAGKCARQRSGSCCACGVKRAAFQAPFPALKAVGSVPTGSEKAFPQPGKCSAPVRSQWYFLSVVNPWQIPLNNFS